MYYYSSGLSIYETHTRLAQRSGDIKALLDGSTGCHSLGFGRGKETTGTDRRFSPGVDLDFDLGPVIFPFFLVLFFVSHITSHPHHIAHKTEKTWFFHLSNTILSTNMSKAVCGKRALFPLITQWVRTCCKYLILILLYIHITISRAHNMCLVFHFFILGFFVWPWV